VSATTQRLTSSGVHWSEPKALRTAAGSPTPPDGLHSAAALRIRDRLASLRLGSGREVPASGRAGIIR